jgi:hypothetical protein
VKSANVKKELKPDRFYGYKHWTLEDLSRCFNVGKGLKKRPKDRYGRNHKWHAIVKRYGLHVEVCIGPMTHEEACAWEVEWVAKENTFSTNHSHDDPNDIGCNFTRGGDGSRGRIMTDIERQRHSVSMRGKNIGKRYVGRVQLVKHFGSETSGFGKVWLSNTHLRQSRMVKKDEVDALCVQGWTRGRRMKW